MEELEEVAGGWQRNVENNRLYRSVISSEFLRENPSAPFFLGPIAALLTNGQRGEMR